MAGSDFWRNLADQFRALGDAGTLRADWDYAVGGRERAWKLIGGSSGQHYRFEALARRAGAEIADTHNPELLIAWLEAVRGATFQGGSLDYYDKQKADGSDAPRHMTGSIDHVCEASANLCSLFEARALQAEFEDKQRNDPRNWSPLRQQVELLESMKKLVTQPRKQISEASVRDVLASQYGIKPEEVTWKQIQFEVSGLLRDYPAITVIPSKPVPEVPGEHSPIATETLSSSPRSYVSKRPGRAPRLGADFVVLAGSLWLEATHQSGHSKVSFNQLMLIGSKLDERGHVPPADYLEGWFARELKAFNSRNSNSKTGAIQTWSRLVSVGEKDHLRGMRRLLSRCAKRLPTPSAAVRN